MLHIKDDQVHYLGRCSIANEFSQLPEVLQVVGKLCEGWWGGAVECTTRSREMVTRLLLGRISLSFRQALELFVVLCEADNFLSVR